MVDKDSETIEIEGKVHNDADFMAAIDAQMSAIDQKAVEKVEPAKEENPEEDQGEKITVKTTASKAQSAVVEQPKPAEEDDEVEKPRQQETLNHEGKKIEPITINVKNPVEEEPNQEPEVKGAEPTADEKIIVKTPSKEVAQQAPKEEVESQEESQMAEDPEVKEEPQEEENAEAREENVVEEVAEETEKEAPQPKGPPQKPEKPQPLKTFDTTVYHLPIRPTRHHRKHAVHPVTATILLLGVVILIGIAAIDMQVLDIGIELPFDLL